MTGVVSIDVPQRHARALRDIDTSSGPRTTVSATGPPRERLSSEHADGVACRASIGESGTGRAPVCEVLVNELDESVTGLIRAWDGGDVGAGDRLFSRVYGELRNIARALHRRSPPHRDDTLDTTAIVHEVYLRLAAAEQLTVRNRAHFFAVAVRASRQIVSNYARNAQALKRGGHMMPESMDTVAGQRLASASAAADAGERASALEEALQELERRHPRPGRVVECRYFGGLSIADTAVVLGISEATVKRDWAVAQAWLHRALRESRSSE